MTMSITEQKRVVVVAALEFNVLFLPLRVNLNLCAALLTVPGAPVQ